MLFSLLSGYYGFTPDYIFEQLTWPQVRMYLHQITQLEFRRHFPMAKLTAAVMNVAGGKPKPGAKGDPDFQPWSPYELLASYARLEDMVFPSGVSVSPTTAREFLRLSREGKLPSWVLATANMARIWAVADVE